MQEASPATVSTRRSKETGGFNCVRLLESLSYHLRSYLERRHLVEKNQVNQYIGGLCISQPARLIVSASRSVHPHPDPCSTLPPLRTHAHASFSVLTLPLRLTGSEPALEIPARFLLLVPEMQHLIELEFVPRRLDQTIATELVLQRL